MANTGTSRRWIIVGLIALGVVLAVTFLRLGSDEPHEGDSDSSEASTESNYDPDGGLATRRVIENCDPITEALKYEEFVDRRALAVLGWDNLSKRAADLEIPVYVKGTADGAVGVSILEIPMRDQYVAMWLTSGHLRHGPGNTYLLDPCSAKVIAWEAMDRLHPPEDDDGEEDEQ